MLSMATNHADKLLPVYLVVGEDDLKRAAVLKKLKARAAEFGDMSFNSDDIDAECAEEGLVVTSCNTMPFASDIRLVLVRNAEKLSKLDVDQLVSYLANPCESTVLALEAVKLAKNTRLYKAVAAHGSKAVIDCAPMKRADLPKAVRAMAVGHGVTLTDGAARTLVDLVGENTVHLDAEIKKIALSHEGKDAVREGEVLSLVARTAEMKPWDFTDAFAARDLNRCLLYLSRMESVSPHVLLSMCVGRVRELICAKSCAQRGNGNAATLAKAFGAYSGKTMQEWRFKNHAAWSRKFTANELRQALHSARDCEQAMKSGTDPDQAFKDWLIAVMRKA